LTTCREYGETGKANDTGANGDGDVEDEDVHTATPHDPKEPPPRPVGSTISVHHGLHSERAVCIQVAIPRHCSRATLCDLSLEVINLMQSKVSYNSNIGGSVSTRRRDFGLDQWWGSLVPEYLWKRRYLISIAQHSTLRVRLHINPWWKDSGA